MLYDRVTITSEQGLNWDLHLPSRRTAGRPQRAGCVVIPPRRRTAPLRSIRSPCIAVLHVLECVEADSNSVHDARQKTRLYRGERDKAALSGAHAEAAIMV
jgi:hypothetical protein